MRSLEKIAFIHDWLVTRGGAERILEAALPLYPGAPVYTMMHKPDVFSGTEIEKHPIHPSGLQHFPGAINHHRLFLPLMPKAVEQFDLRGYDKLVSISYAVAHGVLAQPDQCHIAYVCSPARYAWHLYQDYLEDARLQKGLRGWLARWLLHIFRIWDFAASRRVDHYVAISQWAAACIWRAYQKPAEVLYPPVDVERFAPNLERGDYFLTVARLVRYKKIHLLVEAFNQLRLPLLVVGAGPETARLARQAGPTVRLTGYLNDAQVADLMNRARGFVYAAEEDFGIALVEAQAAGCPVIAFGRGGAQETVISGETGLFFDQQNVDSLIDAIERFQTQAGSFQSGRLHSNAMRFTKSMFQQKFMEMVARKSVWSQTT